MLFLKVRRKGACVLYLLLEAGEQLWILQDYVHCQYRSLLSLSCLFRSLNDWGRARKVALQCTVDSCQAAGNTVCIAVYSRGPCLVTDALQSEGSLSDLQLEVCLHSCVQCAVQLVHFGLVEIIQHHAKQLLLRYSHNSLP